jgi:hypothetical protein
LYTFRQLPSADNSSSNPSSNPSSSSYSQQLQGISVAAGDCLILGADGVQTNVGRVDVVEVNGRTITVASRKPLQLERYTAADPQQQQQQQQVPGIGQQQSAAVPAHAVAGAAGSTGSTRMLTWRLDQDEAASTAMQQRANVLRVAADCSSSRVVWLRRLIVDLAAPRQLATANPTGNPAGQQQQSQAAASLQAGPSAGPAVQLAMAAGRAYVEQHGGQLNSDQVAVLRRVLCMQDYCLVLGMPGESSCVMADAE